MINIKKNGTSLMEINTRSASSNEVLVVANGKTYSFPSSGGVIETQFNNNHKLDASLVATDNDNRFVSSADVVKWNGYDASKQDVINSSNPLSAGLIETSSDKRFVSSADVETWNSYEGSKQNKITSTNMLSATLISTDETHKFVSSDDIATWNAKQSALTFDDEPTANSNNPVKSGGVYTAINNAISNVYKLQGTSNTTTLNDMTKSDSMHGYVYDISADGTLNNSSGTLGVKAGDNVVFIWDGSNSWKWDKLAATVDLSGYVPTSRTVNGHALSANVTVTASDVGLGNVVNTGDSDTPTSGGTTKFTTGGAYTELAKKVDKTTTIAGISLENNISTSSLESALGLSQYLGTSGSITIYASSWDSSGEVTKNIIDFGENDLITLYPATRTDKTNASGADIFVSSTVVPGQVVFEAISIPSVNIAFNYFITKGGAQ